MMKRNSQRLIRAVLDLEKPVIAAVNGVAAGMGAHLALRLHLVIAATEARFIRSSCAAAWPVDAGGAYLLSRMLGIHHAKELVMLGDALAAPDALRPRSGQQGRAAGRARRSRARVGRTARHGPTFALGLSKRLLNRAYESGLETCLERSLRPVAGRPERGPAGRHARFVERRPPASRGARMPPGGSRALVTGSKGIAARSRSSSPIPGRT